MRSINKKHNYLLVLEYNGSDYSGWQRQPGQQTVESTLTAALEPLFGKQIKLTPSGRTDAGVHALKQYCNFKSNVSVEPGRIMALLNARLPKDISVMRAVETEIEFDSRYSAKAKTYEYHIWNGYGRSVWNKCSWKLAAPLNLSSMRKAARLLLGSHDFRAFEAPRSGQLSKIVNLKDIALKRQGKLIKIEFTADRFLYKMVRNIVGTLVEVGLGRKTAQDVTRILNSRKRANAGRTAPGEGLFLKEVFYK